MYDRAPRKISFLLSGTPQNVGPGSYNNQESTIKKLTGDGYAPFMSMASRDSYWNPSDDIMAAPGPGQYDPQLPQHYVKGASGMISKSKRFQYKLNDSPGPGTYDPKIDVPCSAPPFTENVAENCNGGMYSRRIKFHRKSAAPSIPCQGQAYGYEENEDGSLKKQEPPTRDSTIGPAFYAPPPTFETMTTKLYKGIHFGQMKSNRKMFGAKDGPGPADYNPFTDCKTVIENVSIQENDNKCKFEANVPRYLDQMIHNEKRQGVPGPGKYEIPRAFDVTPPIKTDIIPIEQPPFLSQAKRFYAIKSDVPAPGTYNDPRSAMENLKKLSGMKNSPFGVTSVRFKKERVSNDPSPASYDLKGLSYDVMRKACEASTKHGGFGVSSERSRQIGRKDEPDLPGPASYQIENKEPCRPRIVQMSSNFASQSHRLGNPPGLVLDLPSPGAYEVIDAFQKSCGKRNPGPPRTEAARRRQGAFQMSASRFAPPRDVIIAEPDPSVPGPGMYDPKLLPINRGSFIMPRDCRFRTQAINDNPGPGAYEFPPMIQDSILKGTFNATLNNPLASRETTFRENRTQQSETTICA